MKKIAILFALLMLGISNSYANNGLSLSINLGSGFSNLPYKESNLEKDAKLNDADNKGIILYSADEIEKQSEWGNTAIAGMYRQNKHAFEIENFSTSAELTYNFYEEVGSDPKEGTSTYTFSGIGLSYIYYPLRFGNDKRLQPFFRMGRSIYSYEITNEDGDDSEDEKLDSNGLIIGGGVEFFINNNVSIIAGTRYYTTHLGDNFNFTDFGLRFSF